MRFIFICITSFFIPFFSLAQIINIESLGMKRDTSGFIGENNFSFQLTGTNVQLLRFSNNLAMQYKTSHNLFLFLSNVNFAFSDKTDFERSWFFHLRYNFIKLDYLAYEVFSQYQVDRPLRIQNRILSGAGLRIDFLPERKYKLDWGILAMHEYENELENEIVHDDIRMSTYLSTLAKFNNSSVFSAIAYCQPRLDYWRDFRFSVQAKLSFWLWEAMRFNILISVNYDRFPVSGPAIPKWTYKLSSGISVKF